MGRVFVVRSPADTESVANNKKYLTIFESYVVIDEESGIVGAVATERLTVLLDSELAEAVRQAAEEDGQGLSAWLGNAARHQLASRGLRQVVADWEAIHGPFTDEELEAARQRFG